MTHQRHKSEDTRKLLLSIARDMFTELGYSDSSIEHLAKRASVSRKTIYNYFPTKLDLYHQVVLNEMTGWMQVLLESHKPATTVAAKLRATAQASFRYLSSSPLLQRLLFHDLRYLPPSATIDYGRFIEVGKKTIMEPLLPQAIREGTIRPEFAETAATIFQVIHFGILAMIFVKQVPEHMESVLDCLMDVILKGLGGPESTAAPPSAPQADTLHQLILRELGMGSPS